MSNWSEKQLNKSVLTTYLLFLHCGNSIKQTFQLFLTEDVCGSLLRFIIYFKID